MNYGLHVIKNPAGTYSYVGTIPTVLGKWVPATKSDVMGQRATRNDAGELVAIKFPVFATAAEAVEHARAHGFEAKA